MKKIENLKTITEIATADLQRKVDKVFRNAPPNLKEIHKRLADQGIYDADVASEEGTPFDLVLVCKARITPDHRNRLESAVQCITALGLVMNNRGYVDAYMSNVEILHVEPSAEKSAESAHQF